ncbi:type II toxin-antitoxin system ParD family antitoxin [Okeania sp.]|uniref:ribbon-helix-helix domain-containing protein n=1 Tax=Okeania sp. TaxID=3100323 RepID=UPI002B4B2AE1|nr:type II toxin-antitoxin system ParD family antitoxin [Okeania sp.]MEB3339982.1 type II toxin-antitoxin system ParD family antitoxin [Okeania sp.]
MNIRLTPAQEKFIEVQVNSGKFATFEEAIDKALKLLEYQQWLEETREKIDAGVAELDRGEGLDGEVVIMDILNRFKAAREEKE